MKRFMLSVSVFFAAGVLTALAQTPAIRIMPLGDSITYGSSTPGGYRYPLYVMLTNAGYNVDYVGTQTGNATNLLPEINHQGIGGWKISDAVIGLYENMYSWFEQIDDPHVVLVHIGTNDAGGGNFFTNAVDRLDALISRIALAQPGARIIVTTLLPRAGSAETAISTYFNPYVPALVTNQQALGRNVYFLDMHSYLTTNDMYDTVHPTAEGYAKMAAAWFPAITNIVAPSVTDNQPAPLRAKGATNYQQVSVTFNKKLSYLTATNAANYSITNTAGSTLAVTAASLSADQRTVTLSTALQSKGTNYVVTINNVADTNSPSALVVPANSQVSFQGATLRGYTNNVADAAGYTLAYSLDIPAQPNYYGTAVPYSVDNSARIGRNIGRVAYYLELQQTYGTDLQYVWVSMDAFTNDVKMLGVPTLYSGAFFQRSVANVKVESNHPDVTSGSGFTGNIEFWPYNYTQANALSIPGASGSYFDFGDQCPTNGTHGSMQVHNTTLGKTLFGFNRWGGAGDYADLGIGNRPLSGDTDWTHAKSGNIYTIKTLQVFVKLDNSDTTPPVPLYAHTGLGRTLVAVTFNESLATSSVVSASFALNNGVEVLSATLLSDQRTVKLITTALPNGVPLTLTVSGVRDLVGNPVAEGTTVAVAALPKNITSFAGPMANNYELVYALDIPVTGNFIGTPDFYRYNQSGPFTGLIDRVAYYVELQKWDGTVQTLWASMDAFTPDPRKIGVPTLASAVSYQQYVSNLVVKCNVGGVSNGVYAAGGNLEFWYGNYSTINAAAIPGASDSTYDFGDRMDAGTHGCMQIHNSAARQTLFAMNNWGADNQTLAVGIGNQSVNHPDWTGSNNAGSSYARRTLYVLARPRAQQLTPLPPPPAVLANVPEAAGYQHAYTVDLPVNGTFFTLAPTYYSVNNTTNGLTPIFSRVAYYLELQSGTGPTQYVWTAMDAFTADVRKLGVPTNTCFFQQKVTRLDVRSNVGGIVTGTSLDTGNIEFWPSNYGTGNGINIPNASGTTFDFGDSGGSSSDNGHGCMQVHNYGALQTLFAINNFNNGAKLGLGIGNNTDFSKNATPYPDWTFSSNADTYNYRRLYVFVLPGTGVEFADTTRPTLYRAVAARALNQVAVRFSEALVDSAANPSFFTLNNGATVSAARILADKKEIILTTSALTPGQTYALSVTGVRDRSVYANPILPGSTIAFTAPTGTLPAVLSNVAETGGYELIHQLAVGNPTYYLNGCNYTIDESLFPRTNAFDRLAYCLELTGTNGVAKWVYVSMDAFTPDITKIGVPTFASGAVFQQYVSNLNIYASENVANLSVTTGTGIAAGNIEFWPNDYSVGNALGIPNGSSTAYDLGDTRSSGGNYGCMQVHNFAASNTVFAFNYFGGDNRQTTLGIGSQPTGEPDWTFNVNAGTYSTRNIYVLARPSATLMGGTPPNIWGQPRSASVYLGDTASFYVYSPDATAYQWRKNGEWIIGANQASLEIPNAASGDQGTYDAIVIGLTGSAVSQSATLTVSTYVHPPAPRPIRIMPVGDSITYGASTPGGYRLPLYTALTAAGYNIDYVGTRNDNSAAALPDPDHDGLSGWKIDQVNYNIIDWLFAIDDPDVILLHIGTNDSGDGTGFTNAVDRLNSMVTRIATNRPNANIIVTTLLKRSDATRYAAITNYFNPYVQARVNSQRALGRKVHYLNMHDALELTDLYDGLHPNAGGYAKMAAAWYSVITNIVSAYGDTNAPALCRAVNKTDQQGVNVTFSKAMDPATATNISNYALSGGLNIAGATLSVDRRTVTLATDAPLTRDAFYTVTANGLLDDAWPTQRMIAANSSDTFRATLRGYQANVPEAAGYKLVYSISLPNTPGYAAGNPVYYATNNTHLFSGPLKRVAYYLELQRLDGDLTYLWASMDAFTDDINKIGIPAFATGAFFRKSVANMNVVCNDTNVLSGTGLTGNMEFWSCNYSNNSGGQPPGANDGLFDFGDSPSTGGTYGCMQLHNTTAGKTLFALNNWGSYGGILDIGIGNNTAAGQQPDWTFMNNGINIPLRALYVLATTDDDITPPVLVSAQAGSAGTLVVVTFSEALVAETVDGSRFALDNGVSVISATPLSDRRTVNLVTTPQPAGTTLTLTVNGVCDVGGGLPIAPNSTITVAAPALPAAVASNVGSLGDGYQLVYSLDIPLTGTFIGAADPYFYNQSAATGGFDRVAYYLELVTQNSAILPPNNAVTQYVWAAMDTLTQNRKQIGIPTPASGAVFQQYITNLVVKSNVSGVSNGTFVTGGNIEFWPTDYSQANALGIMNASGSYYDFGDTRSTGGAHGSMQLHNAGQSQVLFAMNNWGANGQPIALGIGNRPGSNDKDWTSAANANNYSRRILHVMVHPTAPTVPTAPDATAPTLIGAVPSRTLDKVLLAFSETLSDRAALDGTFALNNGVTVTGAKLLSDKKSIVLSTTPQAAGQAYLVTVSGVRDRSANGNLIVPNSMIGFTAPSAALPAVLTNVPEIDSYALIYQLAISNTTYYANGCNYSVDESRFGATQAFDRVAYCMELTDTYGVSKWAYVSMDAFSPDIAKVGVPTANRGAMFQQYVSNMNVYGSANIVDISITSATGIPAGNIEFWPSNYGSSNDKNIPEANSATYDFGDGGSPSTGAGHGSMQVHNFAAGHTVFALNHFGSDNLIPELGIGNQPTGQPDWTFANNAATYTVKNLYVLVRWGALPPSPGSGPQIYIQPRSRTVFSGQNVSFYVQAAGATAYQWRHNGVWIAGATSPVLEITPATRGSAGSYDVLVYNANGYTVSDSAALDLFPPGTKLILR